MEEEIENEMNMWKKSIEERKKFFNRIFIV